MREDWNARAREDAHYYVAFGRRDQDDAEFLATAHEVLVALRNEIRRGLPSPPSEARFLEIGCGPGRLMKPMSELCAEIHGVDVSDEMIERARRNLAGIAHAHPHVGTGSTLERFAGGSFDFVYSYAVFQHIPSREVVFSYLEETVRVLKPGGVARLQLNGLPPDAREFTTWAGVRISASEIRQFCGARGIQLLALEGLGTQYMWTTWRKQTPAPAVVRKIHRVTNAFSSEPVAPVGGRFAAVSLWVEGLNEDAGLEHSTLTVAGEPAIVTYFGAPESDGLRQVSAILPPGLATGVAEVTFGGATARIRLIPKPPVVPRVVSVSDGVHLLSDTEIRSGHIKVTVEEFESIAEFGAQIRGRAVSQVDSFLVDPAPPRHEVNLRVPAGLPSGDHELTITLGSRLVHRRLIAFA